MSIINKKKEKKSTKITFFDKKGNKISETETFHDNYKETITR